MKKFFQCFVCVFVTLAAVLPTIAAAQLVSSVLPTSRTVVVGNTVTIFATIINGGDTMATGCSISLGTLGPVTLSYQTTNPATNALTGTANTPVDIGAFNEQDISQSLQTFVIALNTSGEFAATDVSFVFDCTNTEPAATVVGVNTLLLAASMTPATDILALAATLPAGGTTVIPGRLGTGALALATANVGVSGAVTLSADDGGAGLPVSVSLCETNPGTGACLMGTVPAPTVDTTIDAAETSTFAVFVTGNGNIGSDPAGSRLFCRFTDAGGQTVGSTSVAVRTSVLADFVGNYSGTFSGDDSGSWNLSIDESGVITGNGTSNDPAVGFFTITGNAGSSGDLTAIVGQVSADAEYSGTISITGGVSGTWEAIDGPESGGFIGSRQQ